MDFMNQILPYQSILAKWEGSDMSRDSAENLTMDQVEGFEKIITDDESWNELLKIFDNGRVIDAWLATDWPNGFDELLLCVPLCKLVEFECTNCTVGKRQNNNSCAHDYSLFGYIAELLKAGDRNGLIEHIKNIKTILNNENYKWDIESRMMV